MHYASYLWQKTRKLDVYSCVYPVLEMIFSMEYVYRDDPPRGWGVGPD